MTVSLEATCENMSQPPSMEAPIIDWLEHELWSHEHCYGEYGIYSRTHVIVSYLCLDLVVYTYHLAARCKETTARKEI